MTNQPTYDTLEIENRQETYWGKCRPFLFDKNKVPFIVIGPHWPLSIAAITAFVFISFVMIKFTIIANMDIFIIILAISVSVAQFISFILVIAINPGVANVWQIPLENIQQRRGWHCEICNLHQSSKTMHCEYCKICIMDMDHHCPWTGKCIGKGNIRTFYGFLLCTLIYMVTHLVITITQAKNIVKLRTNN